MLSLFAHRLRQLLFPTAIAVAALLVLAAAGLLLPRGAQDFWYSLWWPVITALALLGGGMVPAGGAAGGSRRRPSTVSAVELLSCLLATTLAIAAAYGVFRGAETARPPQYGGADFGWPGLAVTSPSFALAALWRRSGRHPLTAALLGLVSLPLAVLLVFACLSLIDGKWGPYVWLANHEFGTLAWLPQMAPALGACALVAAWYAGTREALLPARGRVPRALLRLGASVLTAVLVVGAWAVWVSRPNLRGEIYCPELVLGGTRLCFQTPSSTWIMPLSAPRPRPLIHGGFYPLPAEPAGRYLFCKPDEHSLDFWRLELPTRRLSRHQGDVRAVSPDRRLWLIHSYDAEAEVVVDLDGRKVSEAPPSSGESGALFTSNSDGLIIASAAGLALLDLRAHRQTPLVSLGWVPVLHYLSADGARVVCTRFRPAGVEGPVAVVDLHTGRSYRFPGCQPLENGLVDGRYLWCSSRPSSRRTPGDAFTVIDLKSLQSTPVTAPDQRRIADAGPLWHEAGALHCLFATDWREAGGWLWLAASDGRGARRLRYEKREVVGMANDGTIILWDRERTFLRFDPLRGEERVLVRL